MSSARADGIRRATKDLYRLCAAVLNEPLKADGEREESTALFGQVAEIAADVMRAQGLDELLRIERDHLRPLTLRLRRYVLRDHLQVVRCPWPREQPDPNACAIIAHGGRDATAAAAARAGLRVIGPWPGVTPDQNLWTQVAASGLTVVDYRLAEREAHWPRFSYAVGLALAIGRTLLITTDCRSQLPFDIFLAPYEHRDGGTDDLESALAAAACHVQVSGRSEPGLLSRFAHHAARLGPQADAWDARMREQLLQVAGVPGPDPLAVRRKAEGYFGRPGERLRVETSSFAPAYPDGNLRRCFHVLPFAQPDWVSSAVQRACGAAVVYERGDTAPTLAIMDRIWAGLGRANLVVIDLTGFNANVCLEMAVAQVLGRPLLLVHTAEGWDRNRRLAEIAKLTIVRYGGPDELTALVRESLASGALDRTG